MQVDDFIQRCKSIDTRDGAVRLISQVLAENTVERLGVIKYHPGDGEAYISKESPEEAKEPLTLHLVQTFADHWNIPFDPELYAQTIANMSYIPEGAWNSSSISC